MNGVLNFIIDHWEYISGVIVAILGLITGRRKLADLFKLIFKKKG